MYIKRIKVNNFRSFDNIDVNLNGINLVLGANSSGKSNFIKIFDFLRNIRKHGLQNAISIEGGREYIRNRLSPEDYLLKFHISYNPQTSDTFRQKKGIVKYSMDEIKYDFSIQFQKRSNKYKILRDNLEIVYKFLNYENEVNVGEPYFGKFEFNIRGENKEKIKFEIPEEYKGMEQQIFPSIVKEFPADFIVKYLMKSNELFLGSPFFMIVENYTDLIGDIAIYDFDPKRSKKAVTVTGKNELEEDGSNLSIVLNNIIENKENKKRFINLLQDYLPSIEDLKVKNYADRSLLFSIQEKYKNQSPILPASFLSDGTINIVSLIIALYFENKSLYIFEEPERNIHPHLIQKLMGMFDEVSKKRQIIITTHNPEIIKYSSLENILFISRDNNGFSNITRPSQNEEVKIFLANEIGIDELFIQNLLGEN